MNKFPLMFNKAFPELGIKADFKLQPEDFFVSEILGFEPSGVGEHVFLQIAKTNLTTETLISDVARLFNVSSRDIGYCGMKDKNAVTHQWLSVVWPIKSEIPNVAGQSWQLLQSIRHDRKLRRGIHKGNQFSVKLSNIQGDLGELEKRLHLILLEGFPNYFGEQRFGINGANVEKAESLFLAKLRCKPFQRSIYYSAARSYLFNHFLSLRISLGLWNKPLAGDCFSLQGSNAVFGPTTVSEDIITRLLEKDIHPSGPLFGEGNVRIDLDSLALFNQIIENYPSLAKGLINAKVETSLRPLRVMAKSLNWQLDQNTCVLNFILPSGSYATALIHELVTLNEAIW